MSTRGAVIDGVIFCVLLFVYFLHICFCICVFVYIFVIQEKSRRAEMLTISAKWSKKEADQGDVNDQQKKKSGDVNDSQRPQPSPPVSSLGSKQELPSRSRARTPGREAQKSEEAHRQPPGERKSEEASTRQAPASTRSANREKEWRSKEEEERELNLVLKSIWIQFKEGKPLKRRLQSNKRRGLD